MNHELQPQVVLDERQRAIAEGFAIYAEALNEVAENRYQDTFRSKKIVDRDVRSNLATRIHGNILELQTQLLHVSFGIHTISTAKGTVQADQSCEYLNQELERRRVIGKLIRWHRANIHLRNGNASLGDSYKNGKLQTPPECMLCADSVYILEGDLSALSDDEKCRRSCLILGEIERNRPRFGSALLAPVMISKEMLALCIAAVTAVGSLWGTVPSLAGTGLEIGHRHLRNRQKAKELAGPEADCIAIIRNHLRLNRQHVLLCLAEAGLSGTPEDIVHATKKEMISGW